MLIKSQCREVLITLANMESVSVGNSDFIGKWDISAFPLGSQEDDYYVIGEYSTKEKALKVLDMVSGAYECVLPQGYLENQVAITNAQTVFVMPQDAEVD